MTRKYIVLAFGALALVACGVVIGVWVGSARHGDAEANANTERKILFYRNPMNPAITSPTPAKDEMGMDYIPVYQGEEANVGTDITIAPEIANNLGVRTEAVARGEMARQIDTVGYVGYDEHRLSHVHLRAEGWIEGLRVHSVGEEVRKGELLFRFYSPELVNAQEEYLQALDARDARLASLSRQRLTALGVPTSVAVQVAKTRKPVERIPIFAQQDGVLAQLNVREGMYVGRDMDVMTLADLASVWVLVEVFEQQAAWVRKGQDAEVRLSAFPERVWQGWVDYMYPEIDAKTRTMRVRLRFDNPGVALKPNMYAQATLFAEAHSALHVPSEAVIRTQAGDRLILSLGNGRFQPVTVKTGIESGARTEILEGVSEGDVVVVSAQFLIDSEASLKAAMRRLSGAAQPHGDTFESAGELNAVDVARRKLTLTHEPIPALGWPAMTMDFTVAPSVKLESMRAGMRVKFTLLRRDSVTYEITAMEPVKGKAQ